MNKLKSIAMLITLMLISMSFVANALGGIEVRCKYVNKSVTDFVYNDEDQNNPYVMVYFDDGSQIKENILISEFGVHYVSEKELVKEKAPESITIDGQKLIPIRIKYANKGVTDFVYNDKDQNSAYIMVYFDDGSQIKENNIQFNNGTYYVAEKELVKEKPPESIAIDGQKLIPIRVQYANKGVTDFVYVEKNKNNPYILIYFDNGRKVLEHNIVVKDGIYYIKAM